MNRKIDAQPAQAAKGHTTPHLEIRRGDEVQPIHVPQGHVGPIVLASGRMVYWTGRVAIGLRHEAGRGRKEPLAHGAEWIQKLMLRSRTASAAPRAHATVAVLGPRAAIAV